MMATLNSATAGKKLVESNSLTMASLFRLEGQAVKSAFSINRFLTASSIASMGLMMFAESEDAMQASMVLMVMSMAPAIGSMLSFKGATDSATCIVCNIPSSNNRRCSVDSRWYCICYG